MLDNDLENHTLLPVTSRVKPDKGVPPEPIIKTRPLVPPHLLIPLALT